MALCFLVWLSALAHASESCKVVHGRAHHPTDGGARIWEIGTHHEYLVGDVDSAKRVDTWLAAGVSKAAWKTAVPYSTVYLYADFMVCALEPKRKGAVQRASVKTASHRHYTIARSLQ